MEENLTKLQHKLFELRDTKYRDFSSKLIPTVDKERVIGVRTPILRDLVKQSLLSDGTFWSAEERNEFLLSLPHYYIEENNVHGEIIASEKKDINKLFSELDKFLPYVDNWATCDLLSPKLFKKYPAETFEKIKEWLCSEHTYVVRFGLDILMADFLDDNFNDEVLPLATSVKQGEYYVDMALAWLLSFALIKRYDETLPFITSDSLSVFVRNKAIQKARESYRVPKERKEYLNALKIK